MSFRIEYCVVWNYFPAASRAEQEIKENFPRAVVELIKGSGGIFDVYLNDKLIFSKKAMQNPRFPEQGELTKLVKEEM